MNQKFNACPLCGFKDIYVIQGFDSLGLEHWYMFCTTARLPFKMNMPRKIKMKL